MRFRAIFLACLLAGSAMASFPSVAEEDGANAPSGALLIPLVLAAPDGGEDGTFTGWVLIGLQALSGENTDSSKFLEYRDIPEGLVLPELVLRYEGKDPRTYLGLEGVDVGQLDQRVVLRSGKLDKWNLDFLWDRIPHNLSSQSELIYEQIADNEYRLPADIHTALRSARGDQDAVDAIFDTLKEPYPLRYRRDTYRIDYGWKPHPQWKVRAVAERQQETGRTRRTAQITFMDVNEFPDPLDQRTDIFRLGTEWANGRAFASADVELSRFRQGPAEIIWEQPFEEIAPRRSWEGAIGTPPDNDAWSGTVAAGVNFGKTQRLVGTLSYAQWEQDEVFLPATINPDLDPGEPPRDSLDGRIDRTLLDLRYTARPARRLGINAWYRSYDMDNATDYLVWENVVVTDDFEDGIARGTLPVGYRKSNTGVDFDVKLARRLSLGLGYEREEWRRSYRETRQTEEDIGRLRLDWVPGPVVSLRLRGEVGRRRYDDYDSVQVLQYEYPDEDPADLAGVVSPDQRKYTQADRDRQEVDLLFRWTPIEPFTLGVGIDYAEFDYPDSVLGLATERHNGYSLDLAWVPMDRLRFYGNWSWQTYNWDTQQRYRRNSRTDDPLDDWSSHNEDRTVTWGIGMRAKLLADRLDWTLDWVRNEGRGQLDNEWVPGGDPNGDDIADFPEVSNDLSRLDTEFTVLLSHGWEMRAGYVYEEYTAESFKLDPMQLYMEDYDPSGGSASSNYMAALVPDYRANIFSLLVGYRW